MRLLQKLGVTDDGVLSKLIAMDAASKLQELEKLLVGADVYAFFHPFLVYMMFPRGL